ncbi:MAG: Flp pilus assembly protein CpaB [Actinomycetota bacterium]
MTRRTLAVSGAVVLAAVAAVALTSYVRGVEAKAVQSQEPVSAYVAKEIIPAGKTASSAIGDGLIVKVPVPRRLVPEGSIKSLREIQGKVAGANILKGEQILAARFIRPADARGILPIPADRQAISVEVGIPPGVAGFIQPGDRVSVLASLEVQTSGDKKESKVQYLLQDVQVLSVGQRIVTTESKDKDGKSQVTQEQNRVLMTLALTPDEVERIVYAIFKGEVYFTLVPSGQQPVTTPGRTATNIFG